ncbi:fimbrial biogenesis chaperone [Luteibacter yeojuensis]|uniref:Fimbria/pilus periplasmic chaperone n=1 Tax=Luteibacter yeojuensis TaxID=345309 RepID=A0A7X5TQD6_9GAMM|nr:fimbria/pilus periplasmic chaperone [Luteibacter yeojuensis]NID16426.1 fimbria/pilus periplasmic chaperone [Luteibacter yeojuensis]
MQGTTRKARRAAHAWIAAMALGAAGTASATVVMNGTRYVYVADAKEITVKVSNVGKLPALTQAWIDDGDEKSTPEHVDVPFNLTPPISRVEAGKSQTLRISYTGGEVPSDRESQFWLNILEVPPKPKAEEDVNKLQLAFRYRLKMFYRPKGLAGSADAAPEKLAWRRTADGQISASNPTPFHVTLNDVRLNADGGEVAVEPFAIPPLETVTAKLERSLPSADGIRVEYKSINDYGGFVPHSKAIEAP